MAVELRWVVDPSPACFHAVDLLLRQEPLANESLAAALAAPVAALASELHADAVALSLFLANLVPQSANVGSNRQLASVVLTKTIGARRTEQRIDRITQLFTELEAAFATAMPDFVEKARADAAPLVDAWEEHGEFLMQAVQQLVEEAAVVARADAILVPPLQHGGGAAHLLFNSLRIEVLAPGTAVEIPEVVRLAWLVAQLNADLPMYQGELHRDQLAEVAALAMLPATITAAVEQELIPRQPDPVATAVRAWRISPLATSGLRRAPFGSEPQGRRQSSRRGAARGEQSRTGGEGSIAPESAREFSSTELADILSRWWATWESQRPKWSIALAALDQLLA